MTEPDNFIARWSRRKREVAEEEAKAAASPPQTAFDNVQASSEKSEEGTTGRAPPVGTAAAAPAEPVVDLSSLPSLESITAATDIRGFLAPGVPADLARAALRRAWAADPKIRDFVGLAENAWDFNAPDAMAGFGSLEMTDELRRLVSEMVGRSLQSEPVAQPAITVEARQTPLPIDSSTELAADKTELPPQDRQRAQTPQDQSVQFPDESRDRDGQPQPREQRIAAQHGLQKDEVPQSIVRRPHGRALPK